MSRFYILERRMLIIVFSLQRQLAKTTVHLVVPALMIGSLLSCQMKNLPI